VGKSVGRGRRRNMEDDETSEAIKDKEKILKIWSRSA